MITDETMWLERQRNGELRLYITDPPTRQDVFYDGMVGIWNGKKCVSYAIPYNLFPEVTFGNGPVEIEIKVKI